MSDRLPGRKRDAALALAAGSGHPAGDPGLNGHTVDRGPEGDASEASPVRFLGVNGVLGKQDAANDVDGSFSGAYPALWEFVTVRLFRGAPRETATILFFREDGQWKCCLSDRDTDRVLFRSGDTVTDCLEGLEKALESPRADWRASKRTRR